LPPPFFFIFLSFFLPPQVRAAAADTLLPFADIVIARAPDQLVHLLNILWTAMLDLDDLTASTSSIMRLLATLYAGPGVSNLEVGIRLSGNGKEEELSPYLKMLLGKKPLAI
jgi:hypothetical protein